MDYSEIDFSFFLICEARIEILVIIFNKKYWQAFDLVEHRYVACKLHGLNAQWSEDKKQSYIRHAIREYNIHKTLVHRHIVRLWDIFEIDQNTFCTILEYCSGMIHMYSTLITQSMNYSLFKKMEYKNSGQN